MSRKPRNDSKLKTLPEGQQEQLWDYLYGHTYKDAVKWAAEQLGLETSPAALSEFYSWYQSSRVLSQARALADHIREDMQTNPGLDLSDESISQVSQVAFENLALKLRDPKLFIGLRKLRQKDKEQQQEDRKLKLLEEKARQADQAEEVVKSELSEEEKRAKLREIFGMG